LVGLEITGFAPFISAASRRGPDRESAATRLRDLPSNLRFSERISFAYGGFRSARLVGLEITGFAPFISAASRRGPDRGSAATRLRDLPSNLRFSERISFAYGGFWAAVA